MYCSVCGNALPREMKYCNQCGALLRPGGAGEEKKIKRLDDYLDGTFWTAVFGLGMVLGGVIAMKALELPLSIIIGWSILSSFAFLTVFLICVWQIVMMSRKTRSEKAEGNPVGEDLDTNKLAGRAERASLPEPQSVIEDETRQFEPISEKK